MEENNHKNNNNNFNPNLNSDVKYNNIIYYDENKDYERAVIDDVYYFEKITNGAFIFCNNMESLKLIKDIILKEHNNDKNIIFNLITSGNKFQKIMDFLTENKEFEKCIKNICIYCMYIENYLHLKEKYSIIHNDIYNKGNDIVNFINKYSTNKIKPFLLTKLVTFSYYLEKYKMRHLKISQFYGDLSPKTFNKNFDKLKLLIEKEAKENKLKIDQNKLIKSLSKFEINEQQGKDELIIKEYTNNTFYRDLNKWLMNTEMDFDESIAYFTSRLMYSLNSYANRNNLFCKENGKKLYCGIKLPYIDLISYERAKGKIILFSHFTSTSESELLAKNWSGRDETLELYEKNLSFSVIVTITNIYQKNWISNAINIQTISKYKGEKEFIFQPFSFYYVRDVKIDNKNYTGDIYLETVGKIEILEEKIKLGKEIEFNENANIMQIKKLN